MARAKRKSSTDLQRHVQRAERAGQSLAAYARDNDVAVHSLYYARSLKQTCQRNPFPRAMRVRGSLPTQRPPSTPMACRSIGSRLRMRG